MKKVNRTDCSPEGLNTKPNKFSLSTRSAFNGEKCLMDFHENDSFKSDDLTPGEMINGMPMPFRRTFCHIKAESCSKEMLFGHIKGLKRMPSNKVKWHQSFEDDSGCGSKVA